MKKDILICSASLLSLQLIISDWKIIMIFPLIYFFIFTRTGLRSFIAGAGSTGFIWLTYSIYHYFTGSEIITLKIADMMNLPKPALLFVITFVISFIAGGISALSGYLLRKTLTAA